MPYEHRERAKSLPGARWDAALKCWRVPMALRAEAEALVAELNGNGRGGASGDLSSALEIVMRSAPVGLRATTYKALSKVWHPDTGGDLRLMQALTAVWDRVKP